MSKEEPHDGTNYLIDGLLHKKTNPPLCNMYIFMDLCILIFSTLNSTFFLTNLQFNETLKGTNKTLFEIIILTFFIFFKPFFYLLLVFYLSSCVLLGFTCFKHLVFDIIYLV